MSEYSSNSNPFGGRSSRIQWQNIFLIFAFIAIPLIVWLSAQKNKKDQSPTAAVESATAVQSGKANRAAAADGDREEATGTASQPADLPTSIAEQFDQIFPAMRGKAVQWEKRAYGWEAIFDQDGHTFEAEFDNNGTWLETEQEDASLMMLPDRIKKAIEARFPGGQIKELEIEQTPRGTFYEIEVLYNSQDVEAYYDDEGGRARNLNED